MLKGDKVILRPMKREYLEKYAEFLNDVEIQLLSSDEPAMPMEIERLQRSFDAHLARPRNEFIWFAIEVQGGKFVGQAILHHFDIAARTCELGITIGDRDYHNRGYGRDAVKLMVRYAFRLLNIEKVWLTTNGTNIRGQKSFASSGFVEEARLRKHIWLNGSHDDLVYMACFRPEKGTASPEDDEPEVASTPAE